MLNRQS